MNAAWCLEAFVSLTLQASFVVVSARLLICLAGSDETRSAIWSTCHVLLAAILFPALFLPHPRLAHPWASFSDATVIEWALRMETIGNVVFIVWACGCFVSVFLFFAASCRSSVFVRSCHPVSSPFLNEVLQTVCNETAGCRRLQPVQFLQSARLRSPFCWQFHRPVIVLPQFLESFERREVELIVRHELKHLRTGHPLRLFIQRLVETVYWFHPLVWWSSSQASLSRELMCDAAAVDSRSDIVTYLQALTRIVQGDSTGEAERSFELCFGGGNRLIPKRAARLTEIAREMPAKQPTPRRSRLPWTLGMAACGIALVWAPLNVFNSSRSAWSPWPKWSASALHSLGLPVRDFETFTRRGTMSELREHAENRADQ